MPKNIIPKKTKMIDQMINANSKTFFILYSPPSRSFNKAIPHRANAPWGKTLSPRTALLQSPGFGVEDSNASHLWSFDLRTFLRGLEAHNGPSWFLDRGDR